MGNGSERLEAGDLSWFLRGWQTYCKVRDHGYMFHRDVYDALHEVLLADVPRPFHFVDVGCGDAAPTVAALQGTAVAAYTGIGVSRPALDLARIEVAALPCPATLLEADFRPAIAAWAEPVDVVWIGQSLHHVVSAEKPEVMRQLRRMLAPGGLLAIWEPTALPGEDRLGRLERVDANVATWPALDAAEKATVVDHCRASDHPETVERWLALGADAGFAAADAMVEGPPALGRMYRYRT